MNFRTKKVGSKLYAMDARNQSQVLHTIVASVITFYTKNVQNYLWRSTALCTTNILLPSFHIPCTRHRRVVNVKYAEKMTGRFTYNCSLCEFDVDVLCILEEESYTMITHEGHPHPLTLLLKEVSFLCTACHTIEKDVSYLCTKCQFWIHKSCAFTPTTITHCDHDHPLVLGYSLPYEYRRFIYYCEICKEKVHPSFWVYYCDKCRYFVHMKCATSEITRLSLFLI